MVPISIPAIDTNWHHFFLASNGTTTKIYWDGSPLTVTGNQTKSLEDGIYTIYNFGNQIYRQYNLYEIRDEFNDLLYEVRQDRDDNIDFSKNFNNITN